MGTTAGSGLQCDLIWRNVTTWQKIGHFLVFRVILNLLWHFEPNYCQAIVQIFIFVNGKKLNEPFGYLFKRFESEGGKPRPHPPIDIDQNGVWL